MPIKAQLKSRLTIALQSILGHAAVTDALVAAVVKAVEAHVPAGTFMSREDADPVVLDAAIRDTVTYSDGELQQLARQRKQGETVEDLRRHLAADHVEALDRRRSPFALGGLPLNPRREFEVLARLKQSYPGKSEAEYESMARSWVNKFHEEVPA